MQKNYELRYLPLFYDDLNRVVKYVSESLQNPEAANRLIDAVEKAILERAPYAESFEPFHSNRKRKAPYYRIYVGNFIVYYVVLQENGISIMEVRRFLYRKQNQESLL